MIDTKTIKLTSLPVQIAGNTSQQPTKSGKAGKDDQAFGFNFISFLQSTQRMHSHGVSGPVGKNLGTRSDNPLDLKTTLSASFHKGMPVWMESTVLDKLREGLLAKGKPLNKISLKQADLPLLKDLLLKLGFSEEQGQEILKGLAEKNPNGEILLSQFVQHITEIGIPQKEASKQIGPSLVPQLESALRAFGVRPKEVEQIFTETRNEQGGLDLKKLVSKLKTLQVEMKDGAGLKDHQVLFNQNSDKLEKFGVHAQVTEKTGQISLKDLIGALEQMTGVEEDKEPLPVEIRETINRIIDRVSIPKENQGSQAPLSSFDKLKVDSNAVKEQIIGKDGLLNNRASLQKKHSLAPQGGKGNNQTVVGEYKPEITKSIKGPASPPAESGNHGATKVWKGESLGPQTEKTTFHVPSQTTGAGFSETVRAVKQNQMPTREVLPSYLVDQLSRQISRSIQRGDRVLKIQLKPPELGVVKVALDLKENVLKLGMITENSTVKELLLANANELREALVEQGVKLEKIDVQIGDHFNQSLSDLKEGLKEGRHGNHGGGNGPSQSADHRVDGQVGLQSPYRRDQLLDLVA